MYLVSTTAKDLAFFCLYFFLKRSIPVMFGFSVDSPPKEKGYSTPDRGIILSIDRTISATKLVLRPPNFISKIGIHLITSLAKREQNSS